VASLYSGAFGFDPRKITVRLWGCCTSERKETALRRGNSAESVSLRDAEVKKKLSSDNRTRRVHRSGLQNGTDPPNLRTRKRAARDYARGSSVGDKSPLHSSPSPDCGSPDLVRNNLSSIEQPAVAVLPYATCDLPKGVLMGGHSVLEIPCKICHSI